MIRHGWVRKWHESQKQICYHVISILGNVWIICISMLVGNKKLWQSTSCQKMYLIPWIVMCQMPKIITWVFPKNSGTPKSSILIGFSIINHPFWGIPIFGNTHMFSMENDHQKGHMSFPPRRWLRCLDQEAIGDSELRWSVQGWEQWTDEEGLRGHLEDHPNG